MTDYNYKEMILEAEESHDRHLKTTHEKLGGLLDTQRPMAALNSLHIDNRTSISMVEIENKLIEMGREIVKETCRVYGWGPDGGAIRAIYWKLVPGQVDPDTIPTIQ